MRRLLWIVFAVLLVAVVLNDGGRWFNATSGLRQQTSQVAEWASTNTSALSRDQAAQAVADEAAKSKIRVYQYDQDANGVQIWTEKDVAGTWVIGPYMAVLRGVPFKKALQSPLVIRDYTQAQFR